MLNLEDRMIHVDVQFRLVLLVVVGEEWTPQSSLLGPWEWKCEWQKLLAQYSATYYAINTTSRPTQIQ